MSESGLQWVREVFALLELIVLHRRRGHDRPVVAPAPRPHRAAPAGGVHRTSRRASCGAEAIGWKELVDAGGYAGARERGTLRLEGRDYVMQDGDVITVKFTPRGRRR